MLIYTQYKLHNITSKQVLKFGSETWTLKQRDRSRLEAAQMKFLKPMLGLTRLDHQRNEVIREKLKVKSIVLEIDEYRQNWKSYVERMENCRVPKATLHYKSRGRIDPARPTKRWADQ
jgi:hypothetical protein